jgi:hypothetical protein
MIVQTKVQRETRQPSTRNHETDVTRFSQEMAWRTLVCRPARRAATPTAREAYGCVEWFDYRQHRLDEGTQA